MRPAPGHERTRDGPAVEDLCGAPIRLLQGLVVDQVAHQAELQPGRQPGEQLLDGLGVAGPRPAALPGLHHLRGPPEAPLLRTPLLRRLPRPDRQPGLRGHRGAVRLPVSHLQVRPAAGRPRPVRLRVFPRRRWPPAAGAGHRESVKDFFFAEEATW